jgi:hypothetical protein
MMPRLFALAAAFAIGLGTVANASIVPRLAERTGAPILQVAQGCGPGMWRGPNGVCHLGGAAGAGVVRPCPPGMHLGPQGRQCRPN